MAQVFFSESHSGTLCAEEHICDSHDLSFHINDTVVCLLIFLGIY